MLCFYWSTVIESGEKHQNIHIISCEKQPQPLPSLLNTNNQEQTTTITAGDNYSYVQLTAIHDYNYPVVDEPVSSVIHARRDSTCSLKKRSAIDMAAPPTKEAPLKSRLRCRYVVTILCIYDAYAIMPGFHMPQILPRILHWRMESQGSVRICAGLF